MVVSLGSSISCDEQEISTPEPKAYPLCWDSGYWSAGAEEPAVVDEISITEMESGKCLLRPSTPKKLWFTRGPRLHLKLLVLLRG